MTTVGTVDTVLCGTRECIQWYCILSMFFHFFQLLLIGHEASYNVPRLLFGLTVVTVEIIMQLYLFLAMLKFSRRMLRMYLTYLRVWAVLTVLYGLACLIGFLAFRYNFASFESPDRPRRRPRGFLELGAFAKGLGIFEAYPVSTSMGAVQFVLLVVIAVTLEVVYAAFLYWRLRLYYRRMPDDVFPFSKVPVSPEGGDGSPRGVPVPPPQMPLQYVAPPQGQPYPGPWPAYSMPGMPPQHPAP